MKSSRFLVLLTVVLLFVAVPVALSQTAVPQKTLWRVLVGDHDRMTVVNSIERGWFPDEGQQFYVPDCQNAAAPIADTTYIYRLYDLATGDHRDSLTDLAGYYTEWPEGCGWNSDSSLKGLSPIFETFNTTTGDYSITKPGEALAGYNKRNNLGPLGYKRYGLQKEVPLNIKGNTLNVDSNLVAGGNVWHWTWNGMQYLNTAGYPRGMHTEVFGLPGPSDDISGDAYEPGDSYSFFPDLASNVHGAPLISALNSGKTQTTSAVPIEFNMFDFGGDQDRPVLWQDLALGKTLTLDFHGDPNVAKYRVNFTYPGKSDYLEVSHVMYLRGIFTRYFIYDALSDNLSEITSEMDSCAASGRTIYLGIGGVIASDSTGQFAIGTYGSDPTFGGSVGGFILRPRICPELGSYWINPESEDSWSTIVLRSDYGGPITQLNNSFDRYIVTSSLTEARASMRRLYLAGVR